MTLFDENAFFQLLSTLATTPGPSLNEGPRRSALIDWLDKNGVKATIDRAGNIWVDLSAGMWEDTIVLDAHIDVVQEGYVPKIYPDKGKIFGMGVCDNLTSACLLALLARSVAAGDMILKKPVKILFSVGEEGDGNLKGIRQVVNDFRLPPDMLIAFDLSFDKYTVEALGSRRYEVVVTGKGGHSWSDYGTPGAIETLIGFFNRLETAFLPVRQENEGIISYNTGTIQGGEGINSISASARGTFEFRSVSPDLLKRMDAVVSDLVAETNTIKDIGIKLTLTGERPAAVAVDRDRLEPIVRAALKPVCDSPVAVPRSTNINVPLAAGWPSVCMGLCRGARYHSKEEYVETDSIPKGWEVLTGLVRELAG